jgi:hypothetical protein
LTKQAGMIFITIWMVPSSLCSCPGTAQVRLRLPAGCVTIEGDTKVSRVVRVQTREHEPDGGESVEVALFPDAEDFLWQLIVWLRRRGGRGVV